MNKAFLQFIRDEVEAIKGTAGVQYRINVRHVAKIAGDEINPAGYTMAIGNVDPVYMEADLDVSNMAEDCFNNGELAYLRGDLAHEITHIITNPLADFAEANLPKKRKEIKRLNENLTQRIANIIINKVNKHEV